MRSLSASELLDVWERGLSQSSIQRALTLLTAACPESPPDKLFNFSIGQRDGLLLTLREQMFGSQLVSFAVCPGCGDRLELSFTVNDIRIAPEIKPVPVLSLKVEDYEVQFRLPNSRDLVAVSQSDLRTMRQQLLACCILSASLDSATLSLADLPATVINAVLAEMAQVDPQADVQLLLSCPGCHHQWLVTFDVVSFLWSEIDALARRLLREVHTLAAIYGWREADILAMSPQRRQLYLEMIGG